MGLRAEERWRWPQRVRTDRSNNASAHMVRLDPKDSPAEEPQNVARIAPPLERAALSAECAEGVNAFRDVPDRRRPPLDDNGRPTIERDDIEHGEADSPRCFHG